MTESLQQRAEKHRCCVLSAKSLYFYTRLRDRSVLFSQIYLEFVCGLKTEIVVYRCRVIVCVIGYPDHYAADVML